MRALRYQIKTFLRYQDLVAQLVSRDLKKKYRRSFLGYLWSILNPLLVMIVMTIVFSTMFRHNIANYPVYLLSGRMLFDFFTTSTTQGMKSVTGNQALLKKTYIPKYIFTFAKVTSCMVDTVLSLGALFIVMIATRTPFHLTMLYIPVIILELYVFSLGLAFLLAELEVFFRDIEYIYHAINIAWMYMTPLFYPIEQLPTALQLSIKVFNPMYYYVAAFRDIILNGKMPGPRLLYGCPLLALLSLAIGVAFFHKNQNKFILYL